jgi:hypothetical protein
MGHRVTEPGLSTLRHVHARDPPARINRGSDVGRMDVPKMRLQGRQVWARAPCTLRRHARLPQVGAVAPGRFQPLRVFELVPDASLQPATVAQNSTMSHQATSASEARRRDEAPTGSALRTSCLCNQLEFLRYPGGCYLLWLGRRMRLP